MLLLGALAGVTESYYVSGTNGNNDHLGTQSEPWLTVQYVLYSQTIITLKPRLVFN